MPLTRFCGGGVWGEVNMAAHPNLSHGDAQQIISWIMSLSNKAAVKKSLPETGTIIPLADQKPTSVLVLSASYTDKGGNNMKALTGSSAVSLPGNTISFTGKEKIKDFTTLKYGGAIVMVFPAESGWFALDQIDLTGVNSINVNCGWQAPPKVGFSFEVRMDTPDGKLLGKGTMPAPQKGQQFGVVHVPIEKVSDGNFHSVYFIYKGTEKTAGGVMSVQFNAK